MESPDTLVWHPNAFLECLKPLESASSRFYFYFHRKKLKTPNAVGGTSTARTVGDTLALIWMVGSIGCDKSFDIIVKRKFMSATPPDLSRRQTHKRYMRACKSFRATWKSAVITKISWWKKNISNFPTIKFLSLRTDGRVEKKCSKNVRPLGGGLL